MAESRAQALSPFARAYFAVVGGIGVVTGVALLIAPSSTAQYFAWSIAPFQTATFMGAGYLGTGLTLLILLFLGRTWTDVQLILPPIAVFAVAMMGATLLHADRFFWDRPVTWIWISLYAVILTGAAFLAWQHRKLTFLAPDMPISTAESRALNLVGGLTAAWSLGLYLAPTLADVAWPWRLTPLTGRVIAGWVAVAAALALTAAFANDSRSLRLPLLGWTITVIGFLVTSALGVPIVSGDARTMVYFVSLALSVAGSVWLLLRIQQRLSS